MVGPPSKPPQRRSTTWGKAGVTLLILGYIILSIFMGWQLFEHVTALGLFLNGRAILQIIKSRRNNYRMRYGTFRAIIDGLYLLVPELSVEGHAYFEKLIKKKIYTDELMAMIFSYHEIKKSRTERKLTKKQFKTLIIEYTMVALKERGRPEIVQAILDGLFKVVALSDNVRTYFEEITQASWIEPEALMEAIYAHPEVEDARRRENLSTDQLRDKIFKAGKVARQLKLRRNIEQTIDANIPVYKVKKPELRDTLQSAKIQGLPFRKIWICLNDPDDSGEELEAINEWIAEQNAEAQSLFDRGLIDSEGLAIRLRRWNLVNLSVADKRGAMASAWLKSYGVPDDQLEGIISQLFDHPEMELNLPNPGCTISLNIDSDTVADRWASFVTYLSFVIFDLSGLTSNVRIKNISDRPDPNKPFMERWLQWLLSWLTFFRYDFANNVERAAQSDDFNVVCMSGPWMAVKTESIPHWLGRFVNYTFGGVRIKPGDDRKVTYELNRRKERVGYNPLVLTYTDAPENWPRWRIQQDRWTLSMFANFFTSLIERQILQLTMMSIFDQLYAAGFTFLVLSVFVRLALHLIVVTLTVGIGAAGAVVLPYLIVFITVNLLRGIYSSIDNRDARGMLTSLYVFVVVWELIPIKFRRLFIKGLTEKGYIWGGR